MKYQGIEPIRVWPKISPQCKYVVWIVETSKSFPTTTNPMTKSAALTMIKERRLAGKHAALIKAWSCVQAKKLMVN